MNATQEKASGTAAPEISLAEGEKYRGITLHEGKAMHLVQLPGEFRGTHAECTEWAKALGGELPSRIDGIVLYDGAGDDFKDAYYWLAPLYAGDDASAWYQFFGYGNQSYWPKGGSCRGVAVRRVPLQ